MRMLLDNVDTNSASGPNSFGRAFSNELKRRGVEVDNLLECIRSRRPIMKPDVHMAFIETQLNLGDTPLIQRLDGIYYNTDDRYGYWWEQNKTIKQTYDRAFGVVFQSEFSRRLVEAFYNEHPMSTIIGNGVDMSEFIDLQPLDMPQLDSCSGNVWVAASNWRPHKRLVENVRYFKEHARHDDVLVIAGGTTYDPPADDRIIYTGELDRQTLISLYKRAKYFVHLAFHDNCPNVVVDARAAGCSIICAGASGSPSIAGPDAIVIDEDEWTPAPIQLYNPPCLDFKRARRNGIESNIDIINVVDRYIDFITSIVEVSVS